MRWGQGISVVSLCWTKYATHRPGEYEIQTKVVLQFGVILGLYRDNGKENGNYYAIMGYNIGGIEGIKKKMETTIVGYIGFRV